MPIAADGQWRLQSFSESDSGHEQVDGAGVARSDALRA
jgi:hypothetical protein